MSFDLAGDDTEDLVDARGSPACANGSSLDAEGSLLETCFSRAPHVTAALKPVPVLAGMGRAGMYTSAPKK